MEYIFTSADDVEVSRTRERCDFGVQEPLPEFRVPIEKQEEEEACDE